MEKVTRVDCKQISKVKPIYLKAKFHWCVKRLKIKNKERLIYLDVKMQLSNAIIKVPASSLEEAEINTVTIC